MEFCLGNIFEARQAISLRLDRQIFIARKQKIMKYVHRGKYHCMADNLLDWFRFNSSY